MKDFLDRAYNLRRYTDFDVDRASFDIVFQAIHELRTVFANSLLDLRNVESVFASFEMAELFRSLGALDQETVNKLSYSMRQLIVDTLEFSMMFEKNPQNTLVAPKPLRVFASLLGRLREKDHDVSVLTFNYDLGLDFALYRDQIPTWYALEPQGMGDRFPLLKLHGSLNWSRCPECKTIEVVDFNKAETRDSDGSRVHMRLAGRCREVHACHSGGREVAIVPPTWNKTQHHQQIAEVWRTASKKLSEAENIIIIGYSLPPTDEFFRYLFALGTVGRAWLQRLMVFNPSNEVQLRFRGIFGPMARDRYEPFEGDKGYFVEAMHKIESVFLR